MGSAEQPSRNQLREQIAALSGSHFVNTVEMVVLKSFIDWKVFDAIPDQGDITYVELAEKVGGERELVERFARFLIAAEILCSPAPDRLAHTDKSGMYKSNEIPGGFLVHIFNMLFRPAAHVPSFFVQHGLASPKSASITPMGLAMGHPDKDIYEILDAEPDLARVYNGFVKKASGMYSLKGIYDFEWVRAALSPTRPAVVDIGGNSGRDLLDTLRNNDFLPAERCAVFDLPSVLEGHKKNLDDGLQSVRLVGGSMLEPFPEAVQGAAVYQFRRVLNDFPDYQVVQALRNTRAAAAPDTRILIVEEMLHKKPTKFQVAQDITFMCVGGKRRNDIMYSELAEPIGLRLNAQFHDTVNDCGVLEFVVV